MQRVKLADKNQQQIINHTAKIASESGLVIFPTDTVYICLVDGKSKSGVDKLLAFKERPLGKAISVFVSDETMAKTYVDLNENATSILHNLLPGPFTVVCNSRHLTDLRLEAENGTLGFRIPNYPLVNNLVAQYGSPLTATSANLSGSPHHYSIESLLKATNPKRAELIDLIVDYGKLPLNQPSTVIDTTVGQLITLRTGDLLPKDANTLISSSEEQTRKTAGHIFSKYYSPSGEKPLVFLLYGDMGSGKTVFTKGLGQYLGVTDTIVSPTYTISYEYNISHLINSNLDDIYHNGSSRLNLLIHFDLYRIETEEELEEIGLLDNLTAENIFTVEWSERLSAEYIKRLGVHADIVSVSINKINTNTREISYSHLR